jgi:hypothetical protein
MGRSTHGADSRRIREPVGPGGPGHERIGRGLVKNSLALTLSTRYNAAHLRYHSNRRRLDRRAARAAYGLENRFSPDICAIMLSLSGLPASPVEFHTGCSQRVAQAFQPVQAIEACGYTK